MIAWPSDEQQFINVCARVDTLIDRTCRFPDNVFRKTLPLLDVFDFDSMFAAGFYARFQNLASLLGDTRAYLLVIDPAPVNYFYRHFAKYPLMVIETTTDTLDDYYGALNQDPGNSIADAINTNANALAIVFETADGAIYGERESEIAISAGQNLQVGLGGAMTLLQSLGQFSDAERSEMVINYRTRM